MKKYYQTTKGTAGFGGSNENRPVRVKRFLRITFYIMLSVIIVSCEKEINEKVSESNADKGKAAAADFCNCFKSKSKEECLKELKDNYAKSVYESDEFLKAFNDAQTCNVILEWVRTTFGVSIRNK